MAALPHLNDPNPPGRPPHGAASDPRRARPVPAAPFAHNGHGARDEDETADAHAHEDSAEWERRLRRRRHGHLPGFLVAGVAALALAGGLVLFVGERDESKPTGDSAANVTPAPTQDGRSAGAPSAPVRLNPTAEPSRAAPEPPGNPASSPVAPQAVPEPPRIAASPPEPNRIARAEPEPARPTAAPPSPSRSSAAIPQAEVAGLLKRARDFIEVGDIGAARLLLERAASTNEGAALFALAETYDPAMLTRWRVQGVRPSPDRARSLYQRALEQGVGEARERLASLR